MGGPGCLMKDIFDHLQNTEQLDADHTHLLVKASIKRCIQRGFLQQDGQYLILGEGNLPRKKSIKKKNENSPSRENHSESIVKSVAKSVNSPVSCPPPPLPEPDEEEKEKRPKELDDSVPDSSYFEASGEDNSFSENCLNVSIFFCLKTVKNNQVALCQGFKTVM